MRVMYYTRYNMYYITYPLSISVTFVIVVAEVSLHIFSRDIARLGIIFPIPLESFYDALDLNMGIISKIIRDLIQNCLLNTDNHFNYLKLH